MAVADDFDLMNLGALLDYHRNVREVALVEEFDHGEVWTGVVMELLDIVWIDDAPYNSAGNVISVEDAVRIRNAGEALEDVLGELNSLRLLCQ